MTMKNEEFCLEYCANGYNGTNAYKKVYGTPTDTVAGANATRLLAKQEIQNRIKEIRKNKLIQMQIDADRITEKLAEIAFTEKGDQYYKSQDQLKALDLLAKAFGLTNKVEVKTDVIEVDII